MGVRTIFNILGPLTNPASAPSVLMGVFHPDLVGIQARVLRELGAERAMVVWGRDNMDEISLGAGTLVGELRDGKVREYEIHPRTLASPCRPAATCAWTARSSPSPCCARCWTTARPGAGHRRPERRRRAVRGRRGQRHRRRPGPRPCRHRQRQRPPAPAAVRDTTRALVA
jgi:hypothetical protein